MTPWLRSSRASSFRSARGDRLFFIILLDLGGALVLVFVRA